ncbi:hypothetical protein [Clostridium sp.]|uniref:hypothetical protein n=1 Tax=Clostridium sp. TaxID=1506 RepID=UPI001A58FBA8|nr:hypothetical protein [Clostridium sp.]MBK5239793.1 hypothetical protein [Clostridium sp.]
MQIELGNGKFRIESDSLQFVVKQRKITKAGRMTLPENVGKISYEDIGYFTKIDSALKCVGDQIVLDTPNLLDIIKELKNLQKEIAAMSALLQIEVNFDGEN